MTPKATPKAASYSLSEQDMVDIVEELARNGSPTAQIQAVKLLREMRSGGEAPASDFDSLYAVQGGQGS